MSLQYRAIWSDNRLDLIDTARPVFQEWIESKGINLQIPQEGIKHVGTNEVTVDHASKGDVSALRIRLVEDRAEEESEERWTTTVHWMTHGADGWVWADVEWVSDAAFARPPDMAAPRLVRTRGEHINADGEQGRLGPHPSLVRPTNVDGLIEWILSPDRLVPVVLYSVDQHIGPEQFETRARKTASRLAGCADVRMLTIESEPAFNDTMEPLSLSGFQGAVRVYLPGIDPDDPEPWRHRYTRARNLSVNAHSAANVVVRQILPRMAAQQPPEVYRSQIRHLLDRQRHDWQQFAEELDAERNQLVKDLVTLQQEKEALQLERDIAYEDAVESEREADRTRRKLDLIRKEFREIGGTPESIEQEAAVVIDPTSCQESIELAKSLKNISIHPDAPQEIERLDESADSELWAQRIYRHLQSLDSYALEKTEGFEGSFKEWCERSGSDYVLSLKFVAMSESEWVQKNERARARRILPVDRQVAAGGEILMLAHLKTVQGGGTTIPRIYFHDDTKGGTKKVHIGFIGPHDLMPNKSTN
ncbi:MAG: hypothetical protein OXT07_11805 [bacterium]|nr:hypothetical protein [bacterium]